jgi:subtilisin family serine protease
VKEKLAKYSNNSGAISGSVELVILYNDALIQKDINDIGGTLEKLNYGFGIVNIAAINVEKLAAINGIEYIELPKTLYITFVPANTASCVQAAQSIYQVDGEGILIGFIDTGIDYMHPAFMDESGNTRIDYIYDFQLGGRGFNKNDINRAIKSNFPQSIVPVMDQVGHGTHVAGVAAAGGKIDRKYYGVAYKSSIAMIKMTGEGKINNTKSTQIMRGIKLLIDKGKELLKPLVINLSFSTNEGAHDGNSLLEQYINTVSNLERMSFIVAAGNEGNAAHHVGGILKNIQAITVGVGPDESTLVLEMYKSLLDDISIEIKNPSGVSSNVIRVKSGYLQGALGNDKYIIYYSGPTPLNINGEVIISFVAEGQYLLHGPWTITITLDKANGKNYDIWMPISEGLSKETKF